MSNVKTLMELISSVRLKYEDIRTELSNPFKVKETDMLRRAEVIFMVLNKKYNSSI